VLELRPVDIKIVLPESIKVIPDKLNLMFFIGAGPALMSEFNRRNIFRIEIDKPSYGRVQRDRITGKKKDVHTEWLASAGPVSFHGANTVHNIQ
jgi:hypothetical protein